MTARARGVPLLGAPLRARKSRFAGLFESFTAHLRRLAPHRVEQEPYEHPLGGWLRPDRAFFELSRQPGSDLRFLLG